MVCPASQGLILSQNLTELVFICLISQIGAFPYPHPTPFPVPMHLTCLIQAGEDHWIININGEILQKIK